MAKNLLRIFHGEWGGLHQAAFLLGFSTLISQLLALVRDRLLASTFGAQASLDIYYAAFRLPDLVYATIATLVSTTILIPLIVNRLESGDRQGIREFLSSIFSVFCLVMVFVSAGLYLFIPRLVHYIAPGFDTAQTLELITLSRILLLSPFLLGLSNLFGSVTQSFKRFFIYALSPVLYNAGIIFGILFVYPFFGLSGLAWGVIIGAFFHLGVQLPFLFRERLVPTFTTLIQWRAVKEIVIISLPRTITLSAHQLALLVLISLASAQSEGAISIFNFSYNLQSVPLAIVGVSYSVAAFPTLVELFSRGERQKFSLQIAQAARHIIFWSLLLSVLFVVLRAQIVRVILGGGNFTWADTRLTAAALALFSISVIAQGLVLLFTRAYYAAGQTRKPLLANSLSSLITVTSAFVFYQSFQTSESFQAILESLLRVENIPGTAVLVLPLAFSFGLLINLAIYWRWYEQDFGGLADEVKKTFRQVLIGSLLAGLVAYDLLGLTAGLLDTRTFWGIFLQGFVAALGGIIIFAFYLSWRGNREIREVVRAAKRRFWRVEAVSPEPENVELR